eukprot:1427477-Amphidinium_carterae.1
MGKSCDFQVTERIVVTKNCLSVATLFSIHVSHSFAFGALRRTQILSCQANSMAKNCVVSTTQDAVSLR